MAEERCRPLCSVLAGRSTRRNVARVAVRVACADIGRRFGSDDRGLHTVVRLIMNERQLEAMLDEEGS